MAVAALILGIVGLCIAGAVLVSQIRTSGRTLGHLASTIAGAKKVAAWSLVAVAFQTIALVLAFLAT